MPLGEAPMVVLATALRHPNVGQDRRGAGFGVPVVAWGRVRAGDTAGSMSPPWRPSRGRVIGICASSRTGSATP